MKTTLVIDDEVFREIRKLAAARGETLSAVVEDSLRARLQSAAAATHPTRPIVIPTFSGHAATTAGLSPTELAALRDDGR